MVGEAWGRVELVSKLTLGRFRVVTLSPKPRTLISGGESNLIPGEGRFRRRWFWSPGGSGFLESPFQLPGSFGLPGVIIFHSDGLHLTQPYAKWG